MDDFLDPEVVISLFEEPSNNNNKSNKFKPPRRRWTKEEDKAFLEVLKECVVEGYKSDNGFRKEFIPFVITRMAEWVPGCILTEGHIQNKISVWKKAYAPMKDLATASGFGWSEQEQKVTCDSPSVWAEYVRVKPKAAKLRNKPWPMYSGWTEVFGSDRSTGDGARGFKDILASQEAQKATNLQRDTKLTSSGVSSGSCETSAQDNHSGDDDSNKGTNQEKQPTIEAVKVSEKPPKKKLKQWKMNPRNPPHDPNQNKVWEDMIQKFLEGSQGQIAEFVNEHKAAAKEQCSSTSSGEGSKVEAVIHHVGMVGLTDDVIRMAVTNRIVMSPQTTEMFLALPVKDKSTLVSAMATGKI